MIKRILVGLGGEPYSAVATQYAVELAQLHGAELTGVTIVDIERLSHVGPVPIGASGAVDELREHRFQVTRQLCKDAITHFESACAEAGVPHRVRREEGDPFDLIISCARYHDLTICGLKNMFEHGMVDEPPDELIRLIAEGVRPILAVADSYHPVKRALVAYSGSPESAKAMKRFVEMQLWPDVQVRIVTFGHKPDEAAQLVADAADYCRAHGITAETDTVPDEPKHNLLPYATQWNADLIVVGNSAKSLLLRRLFGETALEAIRNSNRALFLHQ